MPKYCSFWCLLDDEKGFSVCRFCVFFVSVRCFSCIGFTFFEYWFYVFRAEFRCFLNTGFVFFVYGFCIFRVRILHFSCTAFAFSVCRECLMSAVILCFACIRRHRMYERQDSSHRLGIGKV